MVRYSKDGTLNGVRNLELPPITERTLGVTWIDEDEESRYTDMMQRARWALDDYTAQVEHVS